MRTSAAHAAIIGAINSGDVDALRQPQYRGNPNPFVGMCYVACEALKFLADEKLTPYHVKHEGTTHWFLRDQRGIVRDPTWLQFKTRVNYDAGIACGFLPTKQGYCKRTALLLERITK